MRPLLTTDKLLKDLAPVYCCLVCGCNYSYPPWGMSGRDPVFEICRCCSVESGHEDWTLEGIMHTRLRWTSIDFAWFVASERPINWSFNQQISNIPCSFITSKEIEIMQHAYDPAKTAESEKQGRRLYDDDIEFLPSDTLLHQSKAEDLLVNYETLIERLELGYRDSLKELFEEQAFNRKGLSIFFNKLSPGQKLKVQELDNAYLNLTLESKDPVLGRYESHLLLSGSRIPKRITRQMAEELMQLRVNISNLEVV